MVYVTSLAGLPADALSELRPAAMACDAVVIVAPSPITAHLSGLGLGISGAIEAAARVDAALASKCAPVVLPVAGAPGGRVVLAPMTALDEDADDVRSVAEVSAAAVARAVEAGARRPLLVVRAPEDVRFA